MNGAGLDTVFGFRCFVIVFDCYVMDCLRLFYFDYVLFVRLVFWMWVFYTYCAYCSVIAMCLWLFCR